MIFSHRAALKRQVSLLLAACLFETTALPVGANSQQLVPVIRQSGASATDISVLKTYLKTVNSDGCTYVLLEQVTAVFGGHLHWHRLAKQVDLALRGHQMSFRFASSRMSVDGHPQWLTHPTIKNPDGLWVPAGFFSTRRFFQLSQSRLDLSPHVPRPVAQKSDVPAAPVAIEPAEAVPETAPAQTTAVTEKEALAAHAIRCIVIDPGHGGKDPGTVGSKGVEEKTVNLKIAQELADRLREQNYSVLLTRTDDTFIPLAQRARLANSQNADLFISIHCNASLSPGLNGLEVYFLSETASDPHADAVARTENASLALEGKSPATPQVQALLRSLVQNANINQSSIVGALMDRELGAALGVRGVSVKQAGFYVLRGAEMPAVLVETGFLTNRAEEKKLLEDKYRKRLVKGIVAAVLRYDERKRRERLRT